MRFEILILGANSALPSSGRYPSSQVVYLDDRLYLVDCGEGAQIKMSEFKVKRNRINQIFISHLHGDHIFGLPGLISSYNLMGRENPLSIFGPKGIDEMINSIMHHSGTILNYELKIKIINPGIFQAIFEDDKLKVYTIPLLHRIPTSGFLFERKKTPLNIKAAAIEKYDLNYEQIKLIKAGGDLRLSDQLVLPNKELVTLGKEILRYAYCSDTKFDRSYFKYIEGVDLLYHEATYTHEFQKKATERLHSTALEAATVANSVNAKKLILGHYSSRYKDLEPLLLEARSIFPDTEIATAGMRYSIN
jgi:ribonuclease Z